MRGDRTWPSNFKNHYAFGILTKDTSYNVDKEVVYLRTVLWPEAKTVSMSVKGKSSRVYLYSVPAIYGVQKAGKCCVLAEWQEDDEL